MCFYLKINYQRSDSSGRFCTVSYKRLTVLNSEVPRKFCREWY